MMPHWRKTTGSNFKLGYFAAWTYVGRALATFVLPMAHGTYLVCTEVHA